MTHSEWEKSVTSLGLSRVTAGMSPWHCVQLEEDSSRKVMWQKQTGQFVLVSFGQGEIKHPDPPTKQTNKQNNLGEDRLIWLRSPVEAPHRRKVQPRSSSLSLSTAKSKTEEHTHPSACSPSPLLHSSAPSPGNGTAHIQVSSSHQLRQSR